MSLKFVATDPLLTQLHREPLLPLLRRWKPFFLERGVDLDHYDWMNVGKDPIREVFRTTPALPPDLADALLVISEMSTTEAYNQLLELAAEAGWDLGERPLGGWSREDIAVRFFVERPDLFDRAVATLQVHKDRNWLDDYDADRGDLAARLTPATLRKLEAKVRDHWHERKRARFAEVRCVDVDEGPVLFLSHTDLPKSQAVITELKLFREVVHYNPETTDLVTYWRDTGRLSVSSRFAKDSQALCAVIGDVCWGDRGRYQEVRLYTGRPLIEKGSKAIEAPSGKFSVRVKACTLIDPDRRHHRIIFQDAHPGDELDQHLRDAHRSGCLEIGSLSLAFRFPDRKREVVVTINDKNKVSVPRHLLQSEQVYRFLVERGFALPPRARAEAA